MFRQAWGGTLSKVLKFAEVELDKGGWPSNNLAARASSAAYTSRPDRGQPVVNFAIAIPLTVELRNFRFQRLLHPRYPGC